MLETLIITGSVYGGQTTSRRTTFRDKNGNVTTFTYNADSLISSETNPYGGVTNYVIDSANRVTRVWGTGVKCEEYMFFNAQSQKIESRDANSNLIWSKTFDRNSICIAETDGNSNQTSYAVNRIGMLTAITYAASSVSTFTYNTSWRKITGATPNGTVWNY